MEELTFLQRLKDRKMVQWALAYLAGAWVLLEAAGHVGSHFGWPAAIQQVLIVLSGFGFFVVLVMAWYHGEQGRQRVSGPELLMIALLFLISGGVLSMLGEKPSSGPSGGSVGPEGTLGVAVLPCRNLSRDPGDAHLADAIHEEIVRKLSTVQALKPIIRRMTVEWYQNHPGPLPQMAAEMGVAYVGECAVQKAGDRFRVTFQLIDGSDETQLWEDSYEQDYTVDNLLDMQSDIARQVAGSVHATVLPEERARMESRPTGSLEAYDLYLLGRSYWDQFSEAGLERAIELFEEAIEIDPGFARAHAGIADSYALLTQGWGRPPVEVFPEVREAAEAALRLDPNLPEAHTSRGGVLLFYDWDMDGAEKEFRRALELDPNYPNAHHWLAITLMARGEYQEMLAEVGEALAVDPMSPYVNMNMGYFRYVARDYRGAVDHYDRTLPLFPDHPLFIAFRGLARIHLGHLPEAMADLERAVELAGDETLLPLPFLGYAYGMAGRESDARDVLTRLQELDGQRFVNPDYFAVVYMGLGEIHQAVDWLYRARDARTDWAMWVPVDPVFFPLHSDSRFRDLVREVGLEKVLRDAALP